MRDERLEVRQLVLTRRGFLAGLGLTAGGLALGVFPRFGAEGVAEAAATGGFWPNVFVHVAEDGLVTIVCHRSEMGQGVRSTLPVLIADELGADLARLRIEQAVGDVKYGNQNTDGSSSVRGDAHASARRAGATARHMLVAAAAARWKVPPARCTVRDHAVFHPGGKKSLGFGALAAEAARLPVPEAKAVKLRPDAELRHIGGPLPLQGGADLVTGRAVFGADVRLPGMLTAVIARPPVVGGQVKRHDAAGALAIPGVRQVVVLPAPAPPWGFQPFGGVAVLADDTWAALRGRAALSIEWDDGENAGHDSRAFREQLTQAVRAPGKVVRQVGDVDAALAGAARKLEAEYHVPHLAHAPMEPPAAVARVDAHACEVWACTQNPQTVRTSVAEALGLPIDQVTVHVTLLGGGFGRKSKADFSVEAALLARAAGRPVRVQWTREDDLRHGYYHTTSAQRLDAGLDAAGKLVAWRHRTAFPSIASTFVAGVTHASDGELGQGLLDLPLAVPNVRIENGEARAHVRIGWLRSVCNIHHAFATLSFADEVAHALGRDPRDVLLELHGPARKLTPQEQGVAKIPNYGGSLDAYAPDVGRLRQVTERVTDAAGWTAARAAKRALGLAAHTSFNSYVAVVVAVSRNRAGQPKVDEAWISIDAGQVLNPDRVHAQMQGAVIFGMSLALHGAITVKDGAVEQRSLRDYRLVRLPEVPARIHVDIVKSNAPPGGVGEPGVPPVAPAIANAVFALTGQRLRSLPLRLPAG